MRRRVLALLLTAVAATGAAAPSVKVRNLTGQLVDPMRRDSSAKAIVLLFVSTECPYSNRSAPEILRVMAAFQPKGVRFWLVYPNPTDSPALIRAHLKAFGYPDIALRDPGHSLVAIAHPSVTPEAAVFDGGGTLVYQGRVDDRFLELGRERPTATKRDLEDALLATLAGKPVDPSSTQAVGCFIADLR
jgi:AhpC/TSA family